MDIQSILDQIGALLGMEAGELTLDSIMAKITEAFNSVVETITGMFAA